MAVKKKRAGKNLAAGRPPILNRRPTSMTRKATKTLINKHHLLEKRRKQAIAKGDEEQEAAIDAEIQALGGLESYQEASLQGQRQDRGGDSSRVLMDWLRPCFSADKPNDSKKRPLLRMLEVGALSTENACSKSGRFDITRIDLNSQGEGILQQDFMERPLPRDDSERFGVISLSLVLNFIPDPKGRGEMLRRTSQFLLRPAEQHRYFHDEGPTDSKGPASAAAVDDFFPSLFLVLPAPCVTNSRYLDQDRLSGIMDSLGYVLAASKTTQRLVYYLWRRHSAGGGAQQKFPKKELRSGSNRNNFAIVLS